MSSVVVIGAGLAGLSAACHLIGQGHQVTVVERDPVPGGRGQRRVQDGFTFDLGPTVLTMPELIDQALRQAGSSLERDLPLRQLDPGYRGVFADGSELLVRADPDDTARSIRDLAGPEEEQAFRRFVPVLERLHDAEFDHFIDANFNSLFSLLAHPGAMLRLLRLGAFGRLQNYVDRHVGDPRVRRMLSFQALYAGLSPQRALAVYAVIAYMDSIRGVFLPEGGMGMLVEGLTRAVSRSAQVHLGVTVTGLLRDHDGTVRGVQTDGGPIGAQAVVCTAELPTAHRLLLPDVRPPRAVRTGVHSPSAVVWHLGVRGDLPKGIAHHNIHFGDRWDDSFTELIDRGQLMSDPSRLITVSSLGEPALAPEGAHSLYVLEPVPNLDAGLDWGVERSRVRDGLAGLLDEQGYPTDIVTEHLVDPTDWAAMGLGAGTPFGLAHLFSQTGPFRPPNRVRQAPGLFFAGSSTVPGVGVPMVMISGKLAAERVQAWCTGTDPR